MGVRRPFTVLESSFAARNHPAFADADDRATRWNLANVSNLANVPGFLSSLLRRLRQRRVFRHHGGCRAAFERRGVWRVRAGLDNWLALGSGERFWTAAAPGARRLATSACRGRHASPMVDRAALDRG